MATESSKAEPTKRKRRWFQFSLRTLMIAVTLLAVPLGYVGWQAKIVTERKALLAQASAHLHCYVSLGIAAPEDDETPILRKWMGDEMIDDIRLWGSPINDHEYVERLRAAFPEAMVWGTAVRPPSDQSPLTIRRWHYRMALKSR